ncbi:hypothetical protein XA68_16137 [Ophiocordyceps unilateralis]|uniref:Uncharacterized protein n=1 Tax=Ophiocordyceps unilateralis TaxID=268505 RepID=A0A2A9P5G9_OPHUN|nr:hypothetical protein XA68_16137 [Ophiocordyceps unilateralis]
MIPQPPASIYRSSTCSVTYGSLGQDGDRKAPQTGRPWTAIAAQDFIHRIDLIAPQDCYAALFQKLVMQQRQPVYARVTMPLEQLLQADFLSECVRKGDALLLSRGRTPTDNVFSLRKGILRMYLDKETFERAGLPGKPYGSKGNRGLKPRWMVSHDLANPPGKKAFDRLLYACQRVFDKPLPWLFCDFDPAGSCLKRIGAHKPVIFTANAAIMQSKQVSDVAPQVSASVLAEGDRISLEETATDLNEWLSLIRLQSPRVAADDDIDPFLSRYNAPGGADGQTKVCSLSWQGFMAASWLRVVVAGALEACSPQQWISISATTLSTNVAGLGSEVTLLRPLGVADEYLMWETSSSE